MHLKISSAKWQRLCIETFEYEYSKPYSIWEIWTTCSNNFGDNCFNMLRPRQNGCHSPDDILKWMFLNENVQILIEISLKFVPRGQYQQYSSIGSDNGLAPTRQQAIIWTNADRVHWHVYASLRGDDFENIFMKNFLKTQSLKLMVAQSPLLTKNWAGPVKFDSGQVKMIIDNIRRGIFSTFLGD